MCAGAALRIDDADAALARLAALDLAAAEEAHADYMACERGTPQKVEAGRTYQRMTRSLRQTLVTRERLQAGLRRQRPAPDPAHVAAVAAKMAVVRERMLPHIRLETEDEVHEQELLDELGPGLEREAEQDRFLEIPVSVLVARLCADLDIDPPRAESEAASAEPRAEPADSP